MALKFDGWGLVRGPSKTISVPVTHHPYPSDAGECVLLASIAWAASTDIRRLLYGSLASLDFRMRIFIVVMDTSTWRVINTV